VTITVEEMVAQVPMLYAAIGCVSCSRIFRSGARCPDCESTALLNLAEILNRRVEEDRLELLLNLITEAERTPRAHAAGC